MAPPLLAALFDSTRLLRVTDTLLMSMPPPLLTLEPPCTVRFWKLTLPLKSWNTRSAAVPLLLMTVSAALADAPTKEVPSRTSRSPLALRSSPMPPGLASVRVWVPASSWIVSAPGLRLAWVMAQRSDPMAPSALVGSAM